MAERQQLIGTRNPFALPAGILGRLAGWVMGRDDTPHREVAALLAPVAGATVCEVGCGPGQLLVLLAQADPTLRVCGIDPSPVMLRQARVRTSNAGVTDRVDLRPGMAGALPLPDREVDYVVAVNSAAIWPDLRAGLQETARVLRPGGIAMIAWHAAGSPSWIQRRLAQPGAWWDQTLDIMRTLFVEVARQDLTWVTAAVGAKPPST